MSMNTRNKKSILVHYRPAALRHRRGANLQILNTFPYKIGRDICTNLSTIRAYSGESEDAMNSLRTHNLLTYIDGLCWFLLARLHPNLNNSVVCRRTYDDIARERHTVMVATYQRRDGISHFFPPRRTLFSSYYLSFPYKRVTSMIVILRNFYIPLSLVHSMSRLLKRSCEMVLCQHHVSNFIFVNVKRVSSTSRRKETWQYRNGLLSYSLISTITANHS